MIGCRIEQLARRLVREETFSFIVAPAIADLQFEAAGGTWPRVRAYVAAWRALAVACVGEIADDCAATLRTVSLGPVLGPAVITLFGLSVLVGAPIFWGAIRSPMLWHHNVVLQILFLPFVFTMTLPAMALPLASGLARAPRPGARRAAFVLAATVLCVTIVATDQIRLRAEQLRRELVVAYVWSRQEAALRDRPPWELRHMLRGRLDELNARERVTRQRWPNLEQRPARQRCNRTFALLLAVMMYALLGIAWRPHSGWRVIAATIAVFMTHGIVTLVFGRVLYVQTVFGSWALVWTPVTLLFLTALLVAVRSRAA